jgi:hypothetical protein
MCVCVRVVTVPLARHAACIVPANSEKTYTSYRCGCCGCCCSRHRMGTTYYLQTPAPAPVPRTSRQSSQ